MLNYYILGVSSTITSLTASTPPFLSVEFLGSSTDIGTAYSHILTKKPMWFLSTKTLFRLVKKGFPCLRKASIPIFTAGKRQPEVKMLFYNLATCTLSNSANVDHLEFNK